MHTSGFPGSTGGLSDVLRHSSLSEVSFSVTVYRELGACPSGHGIDGRLPAPRRRTETMASIVGTSIGVQPLVLLELSGTGSLSSISRRRPANAGAILDPPDATASSRPTPA